MTPVGMAVFVSVLGHSTGPARSTIDEVAIACEEW